MEAPQKPHYSAKLLLVILVTGFLVGGFPSILGLTIVASDSRPAFTLDICHPLSSLSSPSGVAFELPVPSFSLKPALIDFGESILPAMAAPRDRYDAPDPPPPRQDSI
jgi:K+-transporting ATPase A subunit